MQAKDKVERNFIEALLGLMLEPGATTEDLLDTDDPPYAVTLVICLLLTIFVPVGAQLWKYGMTVYNPEAILSLFLVVVFTFLFFLFLEGLVLRLLGVEFDFNHLFAIGAYCLAPLLLAIWLIYFFNYLSTGRLSILNILLTGYVAADDRFIHVVPIALLIAQLNILVVFFYSIRFIGEMHNTTAWLVTLMSLAIFVASLLSGVVLGEIAHEGTFEIFMRILTSPAALTAYRI